MEENNKKEKKALKLKIKTFADLKRFTSKQLHKIVEKFREKNKDLKELSLEEILENEKWTKAMGAVVRQSLINRSDSKRLQRAKVINEKKAELQEDIKQYHEDVREGELTGKEQQKVYNKLADRVYKINKEIYTRDLGPKDQEKPKNPMIQRAVKNVAKAAKTVGKGIVTAAKISASIAVLPFVGLYQGAKFVGKKALALGRGGKVAALTAGKVVSNTAKAVAENVKGQVEPIATQVKETEEARRDSKNAKTFEEKREIYENANEEIQKAIYEDDYKAALKENAKREREAARREKLHMNAEQQPIDHEEAKKKTFERVDGQELTSEEEKEVYGDEEK